MLTTIKKGVMKNEPVQVNVDTDEEASTALSNPEFREILSFGPVFDEIRNDLGIDLLDYGSLDDYMVTVKAELVRRSGRVADDCKRSINDSRTSPVVG